MSSWAMRACKGVWAFALELSSIASATGLAWSLGAARVPGLENRFTSLPVSVESRLASWLALGCCVYGWAAGYPAAPKCVGGVWGQRQDAPRRGCGGALTSEESLGLVVATPSATGPPRGLGASCGLGLQKRFTSLPVSVESRLAAGWLWGVVSMAGLLATLLPQSA